MVDVIRWWTRKAVISACTHDVINGCESNSISQAIETTTGCYYRVIVDRTYHTHNVVFVKIKVLWWMSATHFALLILDRDCCRQYTKMENQRACVAVSWETRAHTRWNLLVQSSKNDILLDVFSTHQLCGGTTDDTRIQVWVPTM